MNKKLTFLLGTTLFLSLGSLIHFPFEQNNQIVKAEEDFFHGVQATYGGTNAKMLSSSECVTANVPEGYTDSVLKVTGSTSSTFNFDFTNANIKINDNLRITLRLYSQGTLSSKYPELRSKGNTDSWLINGSGDFSGAGGFSLSTVDSQWYTFTFTNALFINKASWVDNFSSVKDSTILGNVPFIYRCTNSSDVLYIDSVKVDYIGDQFTNNQQFSYTKKNGTVTLLSETAMASEGVGEGYANEVLKMTGTVDNNISVDFNQSMIPLGLIESIKIKVYATGNTSGKKPEFRIQPSNYSARSLSEWPYALSDGSVFAGDGGRSLVSVMNTWHTFVLDNTNLYKVGLKNLESEVNPGFLGEFLIKHRCLSSTDVMYIDSIEVCFKENDHVGPTITYKGENAITIPNKSIIDFGVTAFDEQENRSIDVKTTWSPNQEFDGNGKIQNKGTYSVTFDASDYFGNKSSKTITVIVGDEDNDAPVIDIPFNTMSFKTGTKFSFDAMRYVSDAYYFTVDVQYSVGMLDVKSCLLAGSHTLTITAIDGTGNKSSKVINVIVSDNFIEEGNINNEDDYAVVKDFCINYLGMDTIDVNDTSDTGNCLTSYALAKSAYSKLSNDQKDLFSTDSDFADMYLRLQAWAIANGETFNGSTFNSGSNVSFTVLNNEIYLFALVAVMAFGAISFILLKKRKKN